MGDSFCTWINGGWGGEVVGLSSIDGADASMNETTFARKFELGRWYSLRLRVTPATISAWIDDELVIDVAIAKKWIALREGDIDRSIPFGIAAYSTVAGVRKIEWRPVENSPGTETTGPRRPDTRRVDLGVYGFQPVDAIRRSGVNAVSPIRRLGQRFVTFTSMRLTPGLSHFETSARNGSFHNTPARLPLMMSSAISFTLPRSKCQIRSFVSSAAGTSISVV